MQLRLGVVVSLAFGAILNATPGAGALALVCAESGSTCNGAQARFQATGQFTSGDVFSATSSTPALSAISGYGYVLAWTDYTPADPTALGNLLASYYDLGGKHLTIATYSFSNPWAMSGAVMSGNYAALTNVGSNGAVTGNIVTTVSDPIFSGINMSSVLFFHNTNYTHPGLAPGATLLATDGAGVNMIARSANGVIAANLFPGDQSPSNAAFYSLLAATLTNGTGGPAPATTAGAPAIGPFAGLLLVAGMMAVAVYSLRRQSA